jgi:hypothetical protein
MKRQFVASVQRAINHPLLRLSVSNNNQIRCRSFAKKAAIDDMSVSFKRIVTINEIKSAMEERARQVSRNTIIQERQKQYSEQASSQALFSLIQDSNKKQNSM